MSLSKVFPIGVMLDSFRLPLEQALEQACAVGAEGLQVYAISGEMAPENCGASQRQHFINRCAELNLTIAALCGDIGGFSDPQRNPEQISRSFKILELAADLGCPVVTTHIGVIPEDHDHPRFKVYHEACEQLGRRAEALGVHFAVETGPETAATLKSFLDSLDTRFVGVNYDPANLVMVTGDDPVKGVTTLKDYIVHTHAKDGRKLRESDPEVIYLGKPDDNPIITADQYFEELPLGQGQVDWPRYLAALDAAGYHGFLTIEREVGNQPAKDIAEAVSFLKKAMAE
ncbi:sugar phosphate isomerase/epimerase [Oscillospiraceae bacterium HV4-5-C5C]|nr:sugar phosphate isomerase/epimerase [Oscillospiraceae bacterium HV4-5-C5C]